MHWCLDLCLDSYLFASQWCDGLYCSIKIRNRMLHCQASMKLSRIKSPEFSVNIKIMTLMIFLGEKNSLLTEKKEDCVLWCLIH